ncbi:MAG: hypothetical protein AAGE76_00190 [Pseudomonadota bacterium]
MRIITALAAAVLVAGCAQRAEDISSAYVSPLDYQYLDCAQLADEGRRVATRLSAQSQRQDQQAQNDAVATGVGAILFWPALFFIEGDDETASEVSQLKGELQAIQGVSQRRGCAAPAV